MQAKERTTNRNEITISKLSTKDGSVEIRQGDSVPYSESLSSEISAQQSFLNTHAQRLTNLIHSEVEVLENDYLDSEKDPSERTRRLSHEQLESVTRMGHQLLETIKLGVAVAGVKMQIERGIRNE